MVVQKIIQNTEQQTQEQQFKQLCPFSKHVNFAELPKNDRTQIKNFLTNKILPDTLHEESRKMICPKDFCNGSLMGIPNLHENRNNEQILVEAEDFLNQYFTFNKK